MNHHFALNLSQRHRLENPIFSSPVGRFMQIQEKTCTLCI